MRTLKSTFLILILLLFSFQQTVLAKVETVLGDTALSKNPNLATLSPPVSSEPEIILSRAQYVVSYNRVRRSPNWVAWKLEANQIGKSGRTNLFETDHELEKYLVSTNPNEHAVNPDEYTNGCFDRGHQVPSADRSDIIANNQVTFLMSNMIPQTAYLNRVIWEHLEQHTRELVLKQNKKAFIIAGPIYDQDFGAIGPKLDIQVPSKDFKVIILLEAHQTIKDINSSTPKIAVIMPNTLENGQPQPLHGKEGCGAASALPVGNTKDWEKYQTTVEEVEKESGLILFPR